MQLTPRLFALTALATGLLASSATAQVTVQARATAAIELPSAAIELRAAGVPPEEVQIVLVEVQERELPAPEVQVFFHRSTRLVRVHGPIPNFGSFVRIKLDEGVRGPALVQAIRIEHRNLPPGHRLDVVITDDRGKHRGKYRGGPAAEIRVHGPAVRVHGPAAMVRVHAPGPGGMVHVRGGGSVMVSGGGHGGRGMH